MTSPSHSPNPNPSPLPTPPAPQSAPSAGHPTGELVVHVRKPLGGTAMMTPLVTIDGFPAAVQWGRNAFVAPAGPRRVRAATRYLWDFGTAEDVVPVEPGRTTVVHYSGPALTFLAGRMGPVEQPRPGTAVFWVLMGVLGLLLLLALLGLLAGLLA